MPILSESLSTKSLVTSRTCTKYQRFRIVLIVICSMNTSVPYNKILSYNSKWVNHVTVIDCEEI